MVNASVRASNGRRNLDMKSEKLELSQLAQRFLIHKASGGCSEKTLR